MSLATSCREVENHPFTVATLSVMLLRFASIYIIGVDNM